MIILGYPNDRFHHIWEAAATATTLMNRMIDLGRDDKLPRVLVEQFHDCLLDFFLRYDVALTNQHFRLFG
jgi:hypothetical protein